MSKGNNETERMKKWVRLIRRSAPHSVFFSRLLDTKKYHSDLFMLHRDQLSPRPFPREQIPNTFNPNLTYLLWDSNLYEEQYEEEAFEVEGEEMETPIGIELQQTENSIGMQILGEDFDALWGELQYLVAWAAVEVIRQNESLRSCVESPEFNFNILLEKTRGLKDVKVDGIVKKFKSLENENEMAFLKRSSEDTDVERVAKKLMKAFSDAFTKDPLQFFKMMEFEYFWYIIGLLGIEHTRKMLVYTNITPQLYIEIIDEMHYLQLVKSYRTVSVCEECDIDNPIVLSTGYNLRIQQAENITCPKCGELMHFLSIFKIEKLLSSFILSKDGLLSVFAAWLFDVNGVNWKYSTYPGESECDFELLMGDNPYIVEVKMLSNPNVVSNGWKTFERKLNEGLKQLVNKIKDQKSQPQGILLVNLKKEYFKKEPNIIVNNYLKKRRLSIKKYKNKIEILPYNQLQDFINRQKKLLPRGEIN